MPELPEVETTCAGIRPGITDNTISKVIIRNHSFRWPIDPRLPEFLKGLNVLKVERRAKYILIRLSKGTLIIHLGMSGSLSIFREPTDLKKHDHVDIVFCDGTCLRLNDPRRFGSVIYTTEPLHQHKLFHHLGPEPLSPDFNPDYLSRQCRLKSQNIKSVIMNAQVVVGVGNIYANEALFLAGIHPEIGANKLTDAYIAALCLQIKEVLRIAIIQGGTTLKDFSSPEGKPGYFVQQLKVYGRKGQPCDNCRTILEEIRIQSRSTVFCPLCQNRETDTN